MQSRTRIGRMTEALTDATKATVRSVNDYVLQPVGKSLGVVGPKKRKSKAETKAERKVAVADELDARKSSKRNRKGR